MKGILRFVSPANGLSLIGNWHWDNLVQLGGIQQNPGTVEKEQQQGGEGLQRLCVGYLPSLGAWAKIRVSPLLAALVRYPVNVE